MESVALHIYKNILNLKKIKKKIKIDSLLESCFFEQDKVIKENATAGVLIVEKGLVIRRVSRHQSGRYSCTATNSEGQSASNVVYLRVKCKFCQCRKWLELTMLPSHWMQPLMQLLANDCRITMCRLWMLNVIIRAGTANSKAAYYTAVTNELC